MSKRLSIPEELKREVKEEALHRCAICKHLDIEIHHIVPYRKVKKHEFKNLIALCPNCHRSYHCGRISRRSMLNYKKKLQKNIVNESSPYAFDKPHVVNKPKRLGIVVVSLLKEKEIANKHGYTPKQGILIKTVFPITIKFA